MGVVAREVAQADVDRWLDHKKISERKRGEYADSIASMVEAVSDGAIVVDENCQLIQTLKFPIGSEMTITRLTWKPRLNVGLVQNHLQGVRPADVDGRLVAFMAALTGQAKEIIRSLDTEDYSIGQSIAIFFL